MQTETSAGLFNGLESAELSSRKPYMTDGVYLVEIVNCLAKNNRAGTPLFIAEFTILESTSEAHPPGSVRGWCQKYGNPLPDRAQKEISNILEFVIAAMGVPPKDTTRQEEQKAIRTQSKALLIAACDKQTLRGTKLKLEVKTVKRKDGGDFGAHYWNPA